MATDDRRTLLCGQTDLTGIDFVQVEDPHVQLALRVYFIVDPVTTQTPPLTDADFAPELIRISATYPGEAIESVEATFTELREDLTLDRHYLYIEVAAPGGFSNYTLVLLSAVPGSAPVPNPRIDFAFNGVEFSFKQGCPSDLDCEAEVDLCKAPTLEDFPVDYLARDFVSLRNSLLDFAAQRYPQWSLPVVADAGVMMAEVMAALGDEFAYIQDRYSREAYIGTATQRRSLRHHARLVDYEIQESINGSTLLAVEVGADLDLAAGTTFYALPESGPAIPYTVGTGIEDEAAEGSYALNATWYQIPAYIADPSETELPCGSTSLLLRGHLADTEQWIGQPLLLEELLLEAGQSANRLLVHPIAVEADLRDLLCATPSEPTGLPYTRVTWSADEATPCELDLSRVRVTANLVPATAGETRREYFVVNEDAQVGLAPNPGPPPAEIEVPFIRAVERQGPLNELTCTRTPIVMYSLRASESEDLGWLPASDGTQRNAAPELILEQLDDAGLVLDTWEYRETLLSSGPLDEHFTLDDGMWRQIISFRKLGGVITHEDYATQAGMTVRFGDGEFGLIPAAGDRFQALYRTGPGTEANLPADTVTALSLPGGSPPMDVLQVRNPFAINSGMNEEPAQVIKQLAPEAFRAETFRAVRPEDYDEIAERLPWVQRAGTALRWTGSYLAAFVTPDPKDAFSLDEERRTELEDLVDCVRQVGRCAFVSDPIFVDVDLVIEICVNAGAFGGQVKAAIVEALAGRGGARPIDGFFDPDNFTFGTPLRRSKLEAVVQGVPGVKGVEKILIRARGKTEFVEWRTLTYEVGDDEIIRMQNDPRFPGRGSVRVVVMEVVS